MTTKTLKGGWSIQQEKALKSVSTWLKDPKGSQVFRLFGFAGTGKTTLAIHLAGDIKKVLFGAFTGKAAHVMRKKGCCGASTIHGMIYYFKKNKNGKPVFTLNRNSNIKYANLVIIDECSMIGTTLAMDLLSFGTRILVIGDPAQLPPVKDAGFFTKVRPDVMLTEIHRQAKDNPIIRLSMNVRNGGFLEYGNHEKVRIVRSGDYDKVDIIKADQVLVGMNQTKLTYNKYIRKFKKLDDFPYPMSGERLICLRNNYDKGLLNGGMWRMLKDFKGEVDSKGLLRLSIIPEDTKNPKKEGRYKSYLTSLLVMKKLFRGKKEKNLMNSPSVMQLPYISLRDHNGIIFSSLTSLPYFVKIPGDGYIPQSREL